MMLVLLFTSLLTQKSFLVLCFCALSEEVSMKVWRVFIVSYALIPIRSCNSTWRWKKCPEKANANAPAEWGSLPGWEFPARHSFAPSRGSSPRSLRWLFEWCCLFNSCACFYLSVLHLPLETKERLHWNLMLSFLPWVQEIIIVPCMDLY